VYAWFSKSGLFAWQVAEGRNVYIEMAGNISPVLKGGDQLRVCFHVFHDSRLPFTVRVRDATQPAGARMAFISEPRPARNGIGQSINQSINQSEIVNVA